MGGGCPPLYDATTWPPELSLYQTHSALGVPFTGYSGKLHCIDTKLSSEVDTGICRLNETLGCIYIYVYSMCTLLQLYKLHNPSIPCVPPQNRKQRVLLYTLLIVASQCGDASSSTSAAARSRRRAPRTFSRVGANCVRCLLPRI